MQAYRILWIAISILSTRSFIVSRTSARRLATARHSNVPGARDFCQQTSPLVYETLLEKNDEAWKQLGDSTQGFTVFLPSDAVLTSNPKRLEQLRDDRNLETSQKIGLFHCVNECVTADELYQSGGVVTLGGVVDIAPSRKGGLFGLGGQEDGTVVLNSRARVVETVDLGGGVLVHLVNALVSPELLWRYMDQLRIPGSK